MVAEARSCDAPATLTRVTAVATTTGTANTDLHRRFKPILFPLRRLWGSASAKAVEPSVAEDDIRPFAARLGERRGTVRTTKLR